LVLDIPCNWPAGTSVDDEQSTLKIRIEYEDASKGIVLLSVRWGTNLREDYNSPRVLKEYVLRTGRAQLSQAVEEDVILRVIHGVSGRGYLFTLQDKAPKEGEYEYMTQGMLALEDLLLVFTILTHENSEDVLRRPLRILETARLQENSWSSARP
jgi:hypothetical protein